MLQIEPALLDSYLLIGAFEHREVEIVLLADVIIQHALVAPALTAIRSTRAPARPCARTPACGLEDAKPHALGSRCHFSVRFALTKTERPAVRWLLWRASENTDADNRM